MKRPDYFSSLARCVGVCGAWILGCLLFENSIVCQVCLLIPNIFCLVVACMLLIPVRVCGFLLGLDVDCTWGRFPVSRVWLSAF